MTEIYDEHIEWTQDGLKLDRITDMKERDLRPNVQDCKIVTSSSNNGAYLVARVYVLDKPFDQADISSDRITTHVCSCSDFYFNQSNKLDIGLQPSEIGTCKHIRSAFKAVKAQQDKNQETL